MTTGVIVGIVIGVVLVLAALYLTLKNKERKNAESKQTEVKHENIEALAQYVRAQKQQSEEAQRLKDLKKADMKQKLEVFKQTKEQLKEKLKAQLDAKEWKPLDTILKSADKGGMGIYILYNETKDKFYVGQAKQLYKRVRDHFAIEDVAKDFLSGDKINVKFLTANELGDDYRLDHVEKTGIEIYESDKCGYNRTNGNL